MKKNKLHLFEAFGVELEYMIVDSQSLSVRPVSDLLMFDKCGSYLDEIDNGRVSWSNELALHVVELKTTGPNPNLDGLAEAFQNNVQEINRFLAAKNMRLMPGAMHPWMEPFSELKLWPHEHNQVYEKYNQIFDCRGHGWANLQSTHLNLPFGNDDEFGRLHAAIRLVLPILPAIAASSPMMDGKTTGWADNRLRVYQRNQARIPSIAGRVIPEPVFNEKDYRNKILAKNYADIAPFDPEGVLQDEWLNSRGAIARFSRGAIEIRVLDIQENPGADIAMLKLIIFLIRQLVEESLLSYSDQKKWPVEALYQIFQNGAEYGSNQVIENPDYLCVFGINQKRARTLEIWEMVASRMGHLSETEKEWADILFKEGNLSARISKSLGQNPRQDAVKEVYARLSDCLATDSYFR